MSFRLLHRAPNKGHRLSFGSPADRSVLSLSVSAFSDCGQLRSLTFKTQKAAFGFVAGWSGGLMWHSCTKEALFVSCLLMAYSDLLLLLARPSMSAEINFLINTSRLEPSYMMLLELSNNQWSLVG